MKALLISVLVCSLAAVAPGQSGPRQKVFRDAPTHESITASVKPAPDPIRNLPAVRPPEDLAESKPYRPASILSRSEIIRFGGFATLVPKRAILHLPDQYRGAVGASTNAELVSWSEFYRRNRGWIRTLEVSRAQAEGWTPLAEEDVEKFKDSRQMIVATYQTGPISVMPVKEDAPAGENTEKP